MSITCAHQRTWAPQTRNLGLKNAMGDVVITLDDDVVGVNDQAITRLLEYFDRNPRLGAVNFKVIDHLHGEICNWVHHYPVEEYGDREFSTYEITEGAAAFWREAVARVGYYPDAFFISHEGPDLALRLLNAGYEVIYSPRVVVVHCHAASGRRSWYNYYFDTRNQFWLAARNFSLPHGLRYLCRGLSAMLAYSLRDGFLRYWLRGVIDGLQGLPAAGRQRSVVSREVMALVREIDRNRPGILYYVRTRLFKRTVRL